MKITRHGHDHHVGDYYVELDHPATVWDDREQRLKIRQDDLPDFSFPGFPPSSSSRHDYILSVSLDEVRAMFDAVCAELKKKNGRAV